MKKLLIISLLISNFSMAQTWTQNYPVCDTITNVTFPVGGCYPNADQKITISTLNVTGMQFGAIVSACPNNLVYKMPGNDTLSVGDTIMVTGGTWEFYCIAGNGIVTMDFVAFGTPTTAGQTYPCGNLANWLNDLMLCPQGYSNGLNNNCSVVSTAGIPVTSDDPVQVEFPSNANNEMLTVSSVTKSVATRITAADGKLMALSKTSGAPITISCKTFPAGIYFLQFDSSKGHDYRKFSIVR